MCLITYLCFPLCFATSKVNLLFVNISDLLKLLFSWFLQFLLCFQCSINKAEIKQTIISTANPVCECYPSKSFPRSSLDLSKHSTFHSYLTNQHQSCKYNFQIISYLQLTCIDSTYWLLSDTNTIALCRTSIIYLDCISLIDYSSLTHRT